MITDNRNAHINKHIISPANVKGLLHIIDDINTEMKKGKGHILIGKYQELYGQNLSSNINIPYVKNGIVRDLLVISNPDDAERLAYKHIFDEKAKEYMAAYRIQQWWHKITLSPEYKVGRKFINRKYDKLF